MDEVVVESAVVIEPIAVGEGVEEKMLTQDTEMVRYWGTSPAVAVVGEDGMARSRTSMEEEGSAGIVILSE